MQFSPDYEAFADIYQANKPQLISAEVLADMETPITAMLKLCDDQKYAILLESADREKRRGRYSAIGLKPDIIWKTEKGVAYINRQALTNELAFEKLATPPLDSLKQLIDESCFDLPDGVWDMASGLYGYLGYDMVRQMEKLPDNNPDELNIPESIMVRPSIIALFDSILDKITLYTTCWPDDNLTAEQAYLAGCHRLTTALNDLQKPLTQQRKMPPESTHQLTNYQLLEEPTSNLSKAEYCAIVEKAQEYIKAGDIFQVVPSQRLSRPFHYPPFSLYRSLRRLNPSPYQFYLSFGDFQIVGASPEILVSVRDRKISIRPIAGTRPRGADAAEDQAYADDLMNDPKELAEHLMLLDLGRNDVGRMAEIGSVEVHDEFHIELYSHVMHIVSDVTGTLRPECHVIDALQGGFPAGTVSGAPKVRAMEIIDELEPVRRGVYAGAVGYISASGDMDTCIALRTAVVKDQKMYVQAGGGVVADSTPEGEYQESHNKARALFRAADLAKAYVNSNEN